MQQILNVTGTLTATPLEPTIWLRRPPHRLQTELKPERVQEALLAMPGWTLDLSRKTINRLHEFGDATVALAYAGFIKELTAADGQMVSILVSGGLVGLSLHGYPRKGSRGGITESVLEMAKRLG